MTEPVTIECPTYVWASVIAQLHKLAHETDSAESAKWFRGLAGHIRDAQPERDGFVSYRVAFLEKTAAWLRDKFDLFEMNVPSGDSKAVSEAAGRLREMLASGEINPD